MRGFQPRCSAASGYTWASPAPDAQVPVADHHPRAGATARLAVSEQGRPGVRGLPLARLHRQHHLAAIAPGADGHQQVRRVPLQAGFDVPPSTDRSPTSRSRRGRRLNAASASCQPAFSRAMEDAASGAPAPRSPRCANSTAPSASPCT